jgi:hypothetical protein
VPALRAAVAAAGRSGARGHARLVAPVGTTSAPRPRGASPGWRPARRSAPRPRART